jgi:hypothetical protein
MMAARAASRRSRASNDRRWCLRADRFDLLRDPRHASALARGGLRLDDMDVIEVNEAFACAPLRSCTSSRSRRGVG